MFSDFIDGLMGKVKKDDTPTKVISKMPIPEHGKPFQTNVIPDTSVFMTPKDIDKLYKVESHTLMGVPEHGRQWDQGRTVWTMGSDGRPKQVQRFADGREMIIITHMAVEEHGRPYKDVPAFTGGSCWAEVPPSDRLADMSFMVAVEHGRPFTRG